MRATPSGQQVANFSVATNRVWNDKNGQKQESAEFHNIVVWGRQAEVASKFLNKGGLVLVEGRLQTREWDDKQGQKRKTTEIVADRIQLGPRPVSAQNRPNAPSPSAPEPIPTINLDEDIKAEDLPF